MCKKYEQILGLSKNSVKPAAEAYVRDMIIRNTFKHILIEHVGLTNEEMLTRIDEGKESASTFYSIEDAEKYIKETLLDEYNQNDIAEWLLSKKERNVLKLYMPEDSFEGEFTGKKIKKGRAEFQMVKSVAVIIERDNSANGWHLVTAYPEELY